MDKLTHCEPLSPAILYLLSGLTEAEDYTRSLVPCSPLPEVAPPSQVQQT